MALFGHKKRTDAPAAAPAAKPAVNADDIFGAPVRRQKSGETVYIKESKFDEVSAETVSAEAIDPETIKKKMAELERELEEQKNKPVVTAADFTAENVRQEEVTAAQDDFEEQYRIEHERFVAAHENKEIVSADADDVEKKITEMVDEVEERARAREALNADIDRVGQAEVDSKLAELGVAKDVTQDAEYQNIEAVSEKAMSGVEDYIRTELDTRVPVEEDDDIEAVNDQLLAAKTEEFMKQYGDRKRQD